MGAGACVQFVAEALSRQGRALCRGLGKAIGEACLSFVEAWLTFFLVLHVHQAPKFFHQVLKSLLLKHEHIHIHEEGAEVYFGALLIGHLTAALLALCYYLLCLLRWEEGVDEEKDNSRVDNDPPEVASRGVFARTSRSNGDWGMRSSRR